MQSSTIFHKYKKCHYKMRNLPGPAFDSKSHLKISFITCLISFFFFPPLTLFCYHYADFVTLLFKYEEHFR